jgi:putative flavoprotein involved in K+ transport
MLAPDVRRRYNMQDKTEHFQTIVIGGGQSGLAVGYYLAQRGLPFVVLDAEKRVGDVWRNRWDSLKLFTPAGLCGLPGMPFPADKHSFPTKNEMGDYLESFANHFNLPVQNETRVDHLSRKGSRYVIAAGDRRFEAEHVVVAMSRYQRPVIPALARSLAPEITQLHSLDYRRPSQLRQGGVLIIGAGNSGADIALDVARSHRTWLSGRDTGHLPFRIGSFASRHFLQPFVLRFLFHRVLTVDTPMGRKARSRILSKGGPLIRVKPKDLTSAGVERVARVVGVKSGLPELADGRVLDVANVIWCTGFNAGFSWIKLPVFGEYGMPFQRRGAVDDEPGLYFVGLPFIYAFSSAMIHGVGRDAKRIADTIAQRTQTVRRSSVPSLEFEGVNILDGGSAAALRANR